MSPIVHFTAIGFLVLVTTTSPSYSDHSGHFPLTNTSAAGSKNLTFFSTTISSSQNDIESHSTDSISSEQNGPQMEPPLLLASSSRVTGPYFETNKTTFFITARAGQKVLFDCSVILLQGRTVSWLRRRSDSLQLLTVGNATYFSDPRVGLSFRYPSNWRLAIQPVRKADEGEYQCQLSTHPPKTLIFHLRVIAPAVQILDENGHVVTERHYRVDSSLHLTCKTSHVDKSSGNIIWLKGARPLPGGDSRIKVKVSKSGEPMAYLSVLSVRKGDSGNYTCRASSLASSTIAVHVLNGELPAAVQHGNRATDIAAELLVLICSLALHMALQGLSFS